MARPLRIDFPGALHHATARGNESRSIFLDDSDRSAFLEVLAEAVSRHGNVVHAYCLMGTHFHLLVESPRGNLPRFMRHVNGVYAQRFNRRHDRVGHLFQARYHAVLVEKERHALAVARYVVQNPVRARLCGHPGQWRWSSYQATAGLAPRPDWLSVEWLLAQLAPSRRRAQQLFRDYVSDEAGGRPAALGGLYLGSASFARRHSPEQRPPETRREQWRPVPPLLHEILRQSTDAEIAAAYCDHGYTLREIAQYLGRHYTTVSRRLGDSRTTRSALRRRRTTVTPDRPRRAPAITQDLTPGVRGARSAGR